MEKAGATVLFEDPAKRGNTIGVVVNPVRISSLKDFGTPDAVAEKLLAAERKKVKFTKTLLIPELQCYTLYSILCGTPYFETTTPIQMMCRHGMDG